MTSPGSWKCVGPPPLSPAVPSRSNTLPSGLILMTCSPLGAPPFLATAASVTQTLPSRSTCRPCGMANRPCPMLLIGRPVFGSIWCTAAMSEPSQLPAPQRSMAQISPCGPISMPAVVPQGLPSASLAHCRCGAWNGLGSFSGSGVAICAAAGSAHNISASVRCFTALHAQAPPQAHHPAGTRPPGRRHRTNPGRRPDTAWKDCPETCCACRSWWRRSGPCP